MIKKRQIIRIKPTSNCHIQEFYDIANIISKKALETALGVIFEIHIQHDPDRYLLLPSLKSCAFPSGKV